MFLLRQTEEFVAWLDALSDKAAQVRIAARLRQVEAGNLGDWKVVEGDVAEMRLHFGPGYRLYFTRRGQIVVVLLCGGNKSTQAKDIRRAVKLSSQIGEVS
jgi:putative addiction module killer protein